MNAPVPARIDDLLDHAIGLAGSGRLAEAESACRDILGEQPDHVDALNLIGNIAGRSGRYGEAAEYFHRTLALAPRTAVTLSNLAEALRLQGKTVEAVPLLREAIGLAPSTTAYHAKLAAMLHDLGRMDEALAAARNGLRHDPGHADLNGLAADLLIQQRQLPEATAHLLNAIRQAPQNDQHWERMNRLLRAGSLPPVQGRPWLLRALAHPVILPIEIAGSVARSLCMDSQIAGLVRLAEADALPRGAALDESLARLGSDALLLALMNITYIPHEPLARLFTGLRRALLSDAGAHAWTPDALPFCSALAIQAFLTDYAWFVADEEAALVEDLAHRTAAEMRSADVSDATDASDALAPMLTILGAYRPLHRLEHAGELAARAWPAPIADLIRIQITEPLAEQADRARIPSLTGITDPVSQQVRAQYEEHPYPRWVRTGRAVNRITLPGLLTALGGEAPPDSSFATPEVLIAGCGTGQHPLLVASFYQDAKILAVDISLASLAYARRKTRESGLEGVIEYRQGDILELGSLGRQFHVVESIGVLHHLQDPLAGWRVLVDLLRPGGIMRIGLYSELARRAVVLGREYIAAQGYAPTARDIRRFLREIHALPDDHPLAALRKMRDLYNLSECRDLLFHVQEHRFTLPQIEDALDTLGLRFLGFKLRNIHDYRRRFPDDPRMTSLDNWHVFEQEHPDTFREMYNFMVQKPLS